MFILREITTPATASTPSTGTTTATGGTATAPDPEDPETPEVGEQVDLDEQFLDPVTGEAVTTRLPLDLGLLGVNRPQRSRDARIVTHNLNDLGFVNRFTGESPISWQMNGEFETNSLPRTDHLERTNRSPILGYRQLDRWARAGRRLTVEQYGGTYLGIARIRQLSETGDILGAQTMTTQWQMTLLFEEGGGEPAVDNSEAANTTIGIRGTIGTDVDGDMPDDETGDGTGTGTTMRPVTTPGEVPTPDGTRLTLTVVTVPPDHRHLLHEYGVDAYAVEGDRMEMGMVTSELEEVTLIVTTINQPGPRGHGFWLWLEIWDGHHHRHSSSPHSWDPLDPDEPWIWIPDEERSPARLTTSYNLGTGDPGIWWWLRIRHAFGTNLAANLRQAPTPDVPPQPDPHSGGRGPTYRGATVSDPIGIYWGLYTDQDIPLPPGVPPPDEPTPTTFDDPRARIHVGGKYVPDHMDAGDSAQSMATKQLHPPAWRIPYGTYPVLTFLLNVTPDEVLSIQEYSVTVQIWDEDAEVWEDDTHGGSWLTVVGARAPQGPTLTGATEPWRRYERWSPNVPRGPGSAGANEVLWVRGMYRMGNDIFFTERTGVVWPSHRGQSYRPPPRYNPDPPEPTTMQPTAVGPQRYGAIGADATFSSADFLAGSSSTNNMMTLSGAPAGNSYVAFWSAEQLTVINPSNRLPGQLNLISAFTETRLMVDGTNGYRYVSSQQYDQAVINGVWNLLLAAAPMPMPMPMPMPEPEPMPDMYQRYGAYGQDDTFNSGDMVNGASSMSDMMTLSGAPATGSRFVAFWSERQLTSILSRSTATTPANIISDFAETRLTIGAVNGYLYISTRRYRTNIVNAVWELSE